MDFTLPNGERVKVNDHVYCSPNWAVRDGTPYSIARIMEFLTAEGTTRGVRVKGKDVFTRVRLAWYYRPSDVSDRQVTDSRLLLCAIYSEVIPITQLRAKCYVKHKDKIVDLIAWKKRPDRFYYNRLFDPFIKREFEVILTSEIHNLPRHIKDTLSSRYDMIVTEKECVAELTDNLRLCDSCGEWCPSTDSVQCDGCKSHFHMACVQPPLVAKPARGYGWSCARCAHKDDDEEGTRSVPPNPATAKPKSVVGPGPRPRGRPKGSRNNTNSPVKPPQEEGEDKYYKMWPFRYFGQYTLAEDTLDPEDIIFPRANTRVGIKFQTSVPATGSSLPAPGPDIPERGTDETVEILSCISRMSEEEVAEVEGCKAVLTSRKEFLFNVDWLSEVIRRFSIAYLQKERPSTVSMKNPLRAAKWKKEDVRYGDKEWNDNEINAFEGAIQEFGPELRSVRDQVITRTLPEVVRFFTLWKNTHLQAENRRIIEARQKGLQIQNKPVIRQPSAAASEEEKSVINIKAESRGTAAYSTCAACRTRQSSVWWKAPKGLSTAVLCDDCGVHWRKYGDLNLKPPKEESLPSVKQKTMATDKREGTPLAGPAAKRMKVSVGAAPMIPPMLVKHITCQCCKRSGAFGKVIKCIQCSMSLHAGICGALSSGSVMDTTEAEGWLCEICQNETSLEASLMTECVLCPRKRKDERKKPGPVPKDEMDLGFLRARKPTEGQGWVHILCSLFASEVVYTDAARLRLVEGISSIVQMRWQTICSLCRRSGGACVKCSVCAAEYHPACAWKAGHKVAFEMQGVKASKRDVTVQIDFKRDTGAMTPVVFCKSHPLDGRRIHEFCDLNEHGETALQVYTKHYKQAPLDNSYGLLRKARRLDAIMLFAHFGRGADPPVSDVQCYKCQAEFSPFFHPLSTPDGHDAQGEQRYECHVCHSEGKTRRLTTEQPTPSISEIPSIPVGA